MKYRFNNLSTLLFIIILQLSIPLLGTKIVGLVPARNEEIMIGQCLRGLATICDAIIVLDDASEDNTVAIIESLATECRVERIIKKEIWHRDEAGDRNALLQAGREIGGTHFIMLDADELPTANCQVKNYLRNKILDLQPGEGLTLPLFNLWKNPYFYRCDPSAWGKSRGDFIFCDDGQATFNPAFLHAPRTPQNLVKKYYRIPRQYGIIHFQFVNWHNLLIKQAWYRCLEHIRNPAKSIAEINTMYGQSKNETGLQVKHVPAQWYRGYDFFDPSIFSQPELWREKQILSWIKEYGKEFFADLDIWDIDWQFDQ